MNWTKILVTAAWATVGLSVAFLLVGCQHLPPEAKARIRADLEQRAADYAQEESSPENRVTWVYRAR